MSEIKREPQPMSFAAECALKKKLRSLQWQPDAVMRELQLIQNLRKLLSEEEEQPEI